MNKVYLCFPGGKHKALTLSYDDGKLSDRRLIKIFNDYGIKATFHINGGLFHDQNRVQPSEFADLYRGHEVACHTLTHPTIARCPLPEVIQEIMGDRAALEAITRAPVRGLSYPNGSLSDDIARALPMCGIRYSRVVGSSESFAMPQDPYRLMATCHHNHKLLELGDAFLALNKAQYLYLMYVWGHSYEFDNDDNWSLIEEFCKRVSGKDDIWYCTNIQLMDCLDDFARLQFTADNSRVYNPNARDCWIRVNDSNAVRLPGGALTSLSA